MQRNTALSNRVLSGAQTVGVLALLGGIALATRRLSRPPRKDVIARESATQVPAPAAAAARHADGASALLALAALTDSAIEHYRGSFHNKTMYVPLGVAALAFAAALRDTAMPGRNERNRDVVDLLAFATGIIGTCFHLYNVTKRPSGLSWLNVFYGAPLGAPAALSLAGLMRRISALTRSDTSLCGVEPGKLLAWLTAFGLIGTSAEAALFHFRGAYHNPAMVIPVVAPPVAAALLARAANAPGQEHSASRAALAGLAAIGVIGAGFHAYGIQRNMGGWRNWSQNILNGPPLPAPPSFTALALAGLGALRLIEAPR